LVQVTPVRVWVPQSVLMVVMQEAELHHPNESGGVLVGYRDDDSNQYVVTGASGPGPKAKHARFTFEPDAQFQEDFVRATYLASDRRYVYLGDWHSHPRGSTTLSSRDKRTLRGISAAVTARLRNPLMGILAGGPDQWDFALWQFRPARRWFCRDHIEWATISLE
jgi:integrative and conjugative element protein (TIGR02256 family)